MSIIRTFPMIGEHEVDEVTAMLHERVLSFGYSMTQAYECWLADATFTYTGCGPTSTKLIKTDAQKGLHVEYMKVGYLLMHFHKMVYFDGGMRFSDGNQWLTLDYSTPGFFAGVERELKHVARTLENSRAHENQETLSR